MGKKLGMTQMFDESNQVVPVTVVQVKPNIITRVKTPETDGYAALQLATGEVKPTRVNKPDTGQFAKAGITPRKHLFEIRVDDTANFEVGQEYQVDNFEEKALVDVTGLNKGKGYAGVMKRHGFAGQRASHGAHKVHRAPGSIGGCATPGRVFKGMRMAGRMGNTKVTTQNLQVYKVYPETGILLVKGAIPGNKGSMVLVKNAVKGGKL